MSILSEKSILSPFISFTSGSESTSNEVFPLMSKLEKVLEPTVVSFGNSKVDKWRGYEPLKETYNIEQVYSNNGTNFKQLHIIIMQIKSWIRAIPTHVSKWHIQAYFDEFCFRINRSQFKNGIFHKTIRRMVEAQPVYQSQIKQRLTV